MPLRLLSFTGTLARLFHHQPLLRILNLEQDIDQLRVAHRHRLAFPQQRLERPLPLIALRLLNLFPHLLHQLIIAFHYLRAVLPRQLAHNPIDVVRARMTQRMRRVADLRARTVREERRERNVAARARRLPQRIEKRARDRELHDRVLVVLAVA